jgi:hypothetical protein
MKLKFKTDKIYRFRRYTVALRLLALAWIPYAAQSFFILPGIASFLASAFLIVAGAVPLWIISRHTEYIAHEELSKLRLKRKQPTTLLGVVGPKKDK